MFTHFLNFEYKFNVYEKKCSIVKLVTDKTVGFVINGEYPGVPQDMTLEQSSVYALSYIEASSIEKLYTFTVTEEVLGELKMVADRYRKRFMDHNFKSLEILKTLC